MNGVTRKVFAFIPLLLFLLLISSAQAQESGQQKPDSEKSKSVDVEQLKSKVEQLQSFVEQQQRLIVELQNRLNEMDSKARPAALISSTKTEDVEPRPASLEVKQETKNVSPQNKDVKNPAPQNQIKMADKPVVVAGWDRNHAFLRSADGSFETQFTGYAQLDYRSYQAGNHPPDTFLIRRARMALEGKLERYFDFKVEGDFADTTSTLLRDFYVNIHRINELQFRFGQFRVPISQEEIRRDQTQDFVERSMVNNLVPSRSPGLMVSGSLGKGVAEYYLGAFNGKGLLTNNNNSTPEWAVRLRFNPFKNGKEFLSKGLIFGGAFTEGRSLGGTSVRGQTESRSFTFFAPENINGKYIRANGEMTWMLGPAAIRAEYDQANQNRANLGVNGRNLPGVVAKGYMAQVTYLLTGEEKPEAEALVPRHNVFGGENGKPGLGAWELKFRYANLQIADGSPRSNRAETFFFGPNWYLNHFVRYMLDLGVERFKDPLRSPNPRDRNYFVVLSRIQVAF